MIWRWMVVALVAAAGLLNGCGSGSGLPDVVDNSNDNNNTNNNDNTNPGNTSGGGQNDGSNPGGGGGGGGGQTARGRLQVDLIVLSPPVDDDEVVILRQDEVTTMVIPTYRVTVNAHLRDTAENLVDGGTVMAGELNSFFTNERPFVGIWDVRVDVKTDTDPAVLIQSSTPVPVTVVAGQTSRLPLTIPLAASP